MMPKRNMAFLASEAEKEASSLPNVRLSAEASRDGKRVTIFFPPEFIGELVSLSQNAQGRGILRRDPTYGGKEVVGRVGQDGVKYGYVEFNPSQLNISKLTPGATGVWWAKQFETAFLIGSLISDMAENKDPAQEPQPDVEGKVFGEKFASGEHRIDIEKWPMSLPEEDYKEVYDLNQPLPKTEPPKATTDAHPLTIEEAVSFVNKWVAENAAIPFIEERKLFIEVTRRIGG